MTARLRPGFKMRLSKTWSDLPLLKRDLLELWIDEKNALAKDVVKDIEAQRKTGTRR